MSATYCHCCGRVFMNVPIGPGRTLCPKCQDHKPDQTNMTYLEFEEFRRKLIKEAYEFLASQPIKKDERQYDPAFAIGKKLDQLGD